MSNNFIRPIFFLLYSEVKGAK